jgi:hypothetical protein
MARAAYPLAIRPHTETTYTFGPGDWGGIHTNRGAAGNIAYTLPDPTTIPAGTYVDVFCVAAGTVTVGCNEGIVTLNNAAADSVAWSTASEIIGNSGRFVCDGTSWLFHNHIAAEAATTTVGTD